MELAIAQFWSSGIGSDEATLVDFEVLQFAGIVQLLSITYHLR